MLLSLSSGIMIFVIICPFSLENTFYLHLVIITTNQHLYIHNFAQAIADTMSYMAKEGTLLRGEHNILGEAFLVMASSAG